MSRRIAREIAMKLAFAHLLGGGGNYGDMMNLSGYDAEPTTDDLKFAHTTVMGVEQTKNELDHYIGECAHGWTADRMPNVDLCILRIATYEMLYNNTSAGVAINEAVELTKQFGGDRSPNFVNGVLGGIARAYEKGLIVPRGADDSEDDAPENLEGTPLFAEESEALFVQSSENMPQNPIKSPEDAGE